MHLFLHVLLGSANRVSLLVSFFDPRVDLGIFWTSLGSDWAKKSGRNLVGPSPPVALTYTLISWPEPTHDLTRCPRISPVAGP